MFKSQSFSSLIEANNANLANTSSELINGLKILHENQWYTCGNLSLSEGEFPHKAINSSPEDLDYQLLMNAALLLASDKVDQPITVTVGFPYGTYHIYKDKAVSYLKRSHRVEYDSSVFSSGAKKTAVVEIGDVDVVPEIVGCTIALRKGEQKAEGSFFVLSCGFGTFESVLSTDEGIIEQTMISTHGLKYAINIMLKELEKSNYLEFRNAHLLDDAFQKGYIILNRKNIDLREMRKNAIKSYYNEVISPNLRNVITDANLMKTNKIYLCGGGLYYNDLVECFNKEFGDIAQLTFVDDPASLAGKGYALNSLRKTGGLKQSSVGIDIGNATTVVVNFNE
jgi:plasmid segregation protein ParM